MVPYKSTGTNADEIFVMILPFQSSLALCVTPEMVSIHYSSAGRHTDERAASLPH